MKIAFIHPSNPAKESTGASYSANKIIEGLDKDHDLTVYCLEPIGEEKSISFETKNLIKDDRKYRSRTTRLTQNIIDSKKELAKFDIIYSYPMTSIRGLGTIAPQISAKIAVTLNAYGAICPTNTLNYRESHTSLGSIKCLECVMRQVKNGSTLYSTPKDFMRGIRSLLRLRNNRSLISNIDLFVALTQNVKKSYVGAGFPSEKIEIIPPILDEKFLIEHDSTFEEPFQLLHIGYLKGHKGVDRLIPIAENLNEISERDFKLTIVGEGPLKSKLKKQKEKSRLGESIELKGRISNDKLPEVYAKHDLFLYPGRWDEPFGRIFIESLAAGTPVISTETGLTTELEVIETVENEEDFPQKIKNILSKEELSSRSKKGKRVVEQFKFQNTIPRIEEELESLAGSETV
jgi:glycosyltransferase involved in cell wall biosynthesis